MSDQESYRTASRIPSSPHLSCAVWSSRSLEKPLESKLALVPTIKFGSVQINSEFSTFKTNVSGLKAIYLHSDERTKFLGKAGGSLSYLIYFNYHIYNACSTLLFTFCTCYFQLLLQQSEHINPHLPSWGRWDISTDLEICALDESAAQHLSWHFVIPSPTHIDRNLSTDYWLWLHFSSCSTIGGGYSGATGQIYP